MKTYGDFSATELLGIIGAVKQHPQFEQERLIGYVCLDDDSSIRIGTKPADYSAPSAFDLEFVVRWDGSQYVVDDNYAEFS